MIYFVQDSATRRIKIGFAEDPWKRLSKIQSDSPSDVVLLAVQAGDRSVEAALHLTFGGDRHRGEWFSPSGSLLAYISDLPTAVRPSAGRRYRNTWGNSGMTDADVAKAVGLSRAMICRLRNGKRRAGAEMAVRIQKLTGVSAIELAFGDLLDELKPDARAA